MDWRVLHKQIILDFILYLNQVSSKYVLKGETSLMLCYNLTRFSEDIDLDGLDKASFFKIVDNFVKVYTQKYNSLYYRVAKDTDTVKRVFIHYGGEKPLKVEVSFRKKVIDSSETCIINGILVYNIQGILSMKIGAFSGRDKIRDLYDIVFIYINYKIYIPQYLLFTLRDAIAFKGLEQFDYLIKNQSDPLINNDELANGFLTMYFDLGLS